MLGSSGKDASLEILKVKMPTPHLPRCGMPPLGFRLLMSSAHHRRPRSPALCTSVPRMLHCHLVQEPYAHGAPWYRCRSHRPGQHCVPWRQVEDTLCSYPQNMAGKRRAGIQGCKRRSGLVSLADVENGIAFPYCHF